MLVIIIFIMTMLKILAKNMIAMVIIKNLQKYIYGDNPGFTEILKIVLLRLFWFEKVDKIVFV